MNKYICWCSDFSEDTGEGKLAHKFIKYYFKKKNVKIIYPKSKFFFDKYIFPFYGLLVLWYNFFKGKRLVYVNYLPLWNFIIFLLSPPNTIFGPITGSIQINGIKSFKSLIRFYLFPVFYKFSLNILRFRSKKIIFSTNILLKYLDKRILKKSQLNFVLKGLKLNKKKCSKVYDFIIYFRKHENKFFTHHKKFIFKELKKGKKILVVGDKINIKGVKQIKRVSNNKIIELIRISKFALSGDDNLLSFFNIDCLNNNVKIIFNHKLKFQIFKTKRKMFLPYSFELNKFLK